MPYSVRYNSSALTFRYFNMANFSNISPRPWEGAYHASELPLIFGTYETYGGPPTVFEKAVATYWQDLYLAFMRDPINALPSLGWPSYSPDGYAKGFSADGKLSSLVPIPSLETDCAQFPLPTQ